MKKRNGFTLIETMGILILLGVIIILVIPSLTKWLKSADDSIDEAIEKLILVAAEDYVSDSDNVIFNSSKYVYCLELNELINTGYVSEEAITKLKERNVIIKVSYSSGKSKYEIDNDCVAETE